MRGTGLELIELAVDAAQIGRGFILQEIIQQARILIFGARALLLRQDVADGLVQRERFGVGGSQQAVMTLDLGRPDGVHPLLSAY